MTTTAPTTRHPFDLPELRRRLSRFVTFKAALSCVLVSRAWNDSFIYVIWFQVDFRIHPRFANLPPNIVSKHGHLIRVVRNANTYTQVSSVANPSIYKLRKLHIDPTASAIQHVRTYESIHRNSNSLQHLDIYSLHLPTNKRDSLAHYVFSSALVPSSVVATLGLSVLIVSNMSLTNDGLVTILQGSPRLSDLTLACVDLLGPILPFQHTGLKSLYTSFNIVFPDAPTDTSVFSYFPNVKYLSVWDAPPPTFSSARIKEVLTRHCPGLTGYRLQDETGTLVPEFCTNIAANNTITEIMFRFQQISLETVSAILMHQASLKSVRQVSFPDGIDMEAEQVASVSTHFQARGSFLQLIPRGCSKLETLELNAHEMDMDVVEQGEWACKGLKNIQIRVKGLDTKDRILKAIALWRKGCWQRWQEEAGTPVGAERRLKETDTSIEARVARHLLKFDKLWTVWLGYQSWNPI